jgi:hypothetical protein
VYSVIMKDEHDFILSNSDEVKDYSSNSLCVMCMEVTGKF